MIILLGKNSTYKLNDDFLMLSTPTKLEGATTQSLSDFQWWAYSSDFEKWLKENPRQWTADSEDMSKYGSAEEFISENLSSTFLSKVYQERALNFDEYHDAIVEQEGDEDDGGEYVKFHYAYNSLLENGKIKKEFVVANQTEGEEKAIFLTLDDESKNEILESLTAYKISALKTSPNSKMALFALSETLPGGKVPDSMTSEGLLERTGNLLVNVLKISAAALGLFTVIKVAGGSYHKWRLYKRLQKISPNKAGSKFASLRNFAQRSKSIKSLIGKLNPIKILSSSKDAAKFYAGVGKGLAKGFEFFKSARSSGGNLARSMQYFKKGFNIGLKGGSKAGVKWVPVIGWALTAIDVVGSTWNWFSGNQAPRYGEVDDFAKDVFEPKNIPVGIPITICWSQEAGGAWGTVISFVANNETRTTMELVKIADVDSKSIFMITQINSKELGKQLAENALTLVAFDSSAKVETGVLDNDDLDFEISYIKDLSEISVIYNFKGICDWNDIYTAYESSSDKLIVSDTKAPETFNFYFEDTEGEKINVSGKLITDEQIASLTDSELMTFMGDIPSTSGKNESIETPLEWNKLVLESKNILSFEKFSSKAFEINEEDSETTPSEGDDGDLKPSQLTGPAKLAVYLVKEREYANPELRGKVETGEFRNFVVDPKYWEVSDGTPVEVEPNTLEVLEDCIKGVYTYQGEGKPEEPKKDDKEQAAEKEPEKDKEGKDIEDDYYIDANPDDVRIKQREKSTTIRDFNVSQGLNIFDLFLTPRQKEILGVDTWKAITFAKEIRDNRGDVIEVKLKNKFAPAGDRSRKYRVVDGEPFQIAKKFVEETRDRIRYE